MPAQEIPPRVGFLLPSMLSLLFLLCACNPGQRVEQPKPEIPGPEQTDLFVGGQSGYHTIRIPALVTTMKGTVLAFAEGRKDVGSDQGPHDIVLRRSFDGGKTWTPLQVIANDGTNALNNPTTVVDRDTGTTWLLIIRTSTKRYKDDGEVEKATGRVSDMWVMHSDDEGATWVGPTDITKSVNRPDWKRIVPGPGVGIQMQSGRLVISCNHEIGSEPVNHVIYSDDHGNTWRLGGSTDAKTDENQVVELADGSLMLNIRNYREKGHRGISISKDGGLTWSNVVNDPTLIEPVCMASLIRYTQSPPFMKNRLLFSNPATQTERIKMTVRVSYDEGNTWPVAKLLNVGPSGYSCLTVLPDMKIGCLYERGEHSTVEKLTFARFSLEWLTDGAGSIQKQAE
jgi:sialidase-1